MFQDKYVFAQLASFLNRSKFNRIVAKYDGDKYVKHFTCWNQRKQSGNCVLLAIIKSFAAIVFILRFSIISLMLMISLFSMISCISN